MEGKTGYPIAVELAYAEQLSRWKTGLRLFLVIPQYIIMAVFSAVLQVLTFFAWWMIVILGKYPRGYFNFNAGLFRWIYRVNGYWYLFTDKYPPFSAE